MPCDATKFLGTICPEDKQKLRVWPHLPCLPSPKEGALGKNLKKGPCIREGSMDLDIKYGEESLSKWIICYICFHTAF